MKTYDTLSEALNDAQNRGYTFDFNLLENCIECKSLDKNFQPDQFNIVEVHRFEGMTNPDDNSVLYLIETEDGTKGTLVDAYGTYADSLSREMIEKLKIAAR